MFLHKPLLKSPTSKAPPAFYRLRDVMRIAALSRSTIYRRVAEGRFPPPVHLGGRASAWPIAALQEWIDDPEGYRVATPQIEAPARERPPVGGGMVALAPADASLLQAQRPYGSQVVEQVGPELNHPATLIQEGRSVVTATELFVGNVSPVPLDDLAIPTQQLSNQSPRRCPEAVSGDFLPRVIAERAQRAADRVVAHVKRIF
jgi:prophage regulatory protein